MKSSAMSKCSETLLELAKGRAEIALTISVKTALHDRREEATSVMKAELTQIKIKLHDPDEKRSRHIDITFFCLIERVKNGKVIIEHLGTEEMYANILTKPVHGAQFEK